MDDFSSIPFDLIINILNIVVLYVIVRALVYKPVKNFLNARTKKNEEANENIKQKTAEAEQTKADYEKLIAESKSEAEKISAEARSLSAAESDKIIIQAKTKASQIIESANVKIAAEKEKMLDGMKDEIVELATHMSQKILEREINDSDNRKLVDDFLQSSD